MAFKSQYTGAQIDAALKTAQGLSTNTSGWNMLVSSKDNPYNLDNLNSPGNYTINYWENGPDYDLVEYGPRISGFTGPLNLCVTRINGYVYQIFNYLALTYIRRYSGTMFLTWQVLDEGAIIKFNSRAPSTSINVDNENLPKYLWVKTTTPSKPLLYVYDYNTGRWIQVAASDLMKKSIYDSNGVERDLYSYIDTHLNGSFDWDSEAIASSWNTHKSNSTIHVTSTEKKDWNSRVTQSDLDSAIETLKSDIKKYVSDNSTTTTANSESIETKLNTYSNTYASHVGDSTIHPTPTKQAEWDAKASGTHTHNLDGKVTVSTSNISGVLPLSSIDQSALERLTKVSDDTARLALTKTDVQNGDQVYVNSTQIMYFVIDDSKLGSEDAFKSFSTGESTMSWENLLNKPTTVSEFGLTDVYTKTQIDNQINRRLNNASWPKEYGTDSNVTNVVTFKSMVDDTYDLSENFDDNEWANDTIQCFACMNQEVIIERNDILAQIKDYETKLRAMI